MSPALARPRSHTVCLTRRTAVPSCRHASHHQLLQGLKLSAEGLQSGGLDQGSTRRRRPRRRRQPRPVRRRRRWRASLLEAGRAAVPGTRRDRRRPAGASCAAGSAIAADRLAVRPDTGYRDVRRCSISQPSTVVDRDGIGFVRRCVAARGRVRRPSTTADPRSGGQGCPLGADAGRAGRDDARYGGRHTGGSPD